jgi:hypothetical protein
MNWEPNIKGVHELLNLLKDTTSKDNKRQSEIYEVSLFMFII